MRFRRLELIRYGAFADRALDLSTGEVDFHLICGPNEAGKSTTRDSIDDLLFGFEPRTRYGFRHDMSSLRVGGELERDHQSLALQRKKGNKDTLRDQNDEALPDSVLADYLGNADREFFGRMFSLDHEQLRLGGQEILEAKDDVGRVLFEAGAGISGLGEALNELEQEAKSIYSRRAAAGRTYYVAREKFDKAKNRLRDTTVNAREWKEAATELENIDSTRNRLTEQAAAKSAEREKLERIRRVRPVLAEFDRCNTELDEIGEVTDFPDTAEATLADAETEIAEAKSRIGSTTTEIETATKQLDELAVDEALIRREAEINAFMQEYAVVEKNLRDLPNRLIELEGHKSRIQTLLAEIGEETMSLDQLEALLPARATISKVRSQIEGWGSIESGKINAEKNYRDRESAIIRLQESLETVGLAADTTELSATIRFARENGDLRREAETSESQLVSLNTEIEAKLLDMTPWQGTGAELKELPVPDKARIKEFETKFGEIKDQSRGLSGEIKTTTTELNEQVLTKKQTVRGDHAIAAEKVAEVRQRRDLGWELIRRKHIDGGEVSAKEVKAFTEENQLADSFGQAIQIADSVSDQRFDQAEASARLVQIDHRIEQLEHRMNSLSEDSNNLDGEETALLLQWHALWQPCKFEPAAPTIMLNWLDERNSLLKSIAAKADLKLKIDRLSQDSSTARQSLLDAVVGLGKPISQLESKLLPILIEEAASIQSQLDTQATERRNLEKQLGENRVDLDGDKRSVDEANEVVDKWHQDWKDSLSTLGRQSEEDIDTVRTVLEVFDDLREEHAYAWDQSDRITKMENDNITFELAVINLANNVAADLAELPITDVVFQLASRLGDMKTKVTQTESLDTQRARQEELRINAKQDLDAAKAKIDQLLETSKTDDTEALREAIRRSSRKQDLVGQVKAQSIQLRQAGDGKSVEDLREECEGVDPDTILAELEEMGRGLGEINEELQRLSAARVEAKSLFDEISGGADAGSAAEDQQQALAEMEDQAERYVRVQSASMLLRWAIDKYRKEKQAPLLGRAGAIFNKLTVGGFDSLSVDYDDKDRPQITGIRPDQSHVGVDGMSDGTTDQLYLALRVAAVEDYLEKASPLPFIADDLFINFDDERASAGLEVMAELAKHTQVIFFTHHRHLLGLAENAIGSSRLSIHQL